MSCDQDSPELEIVHVPEVLVDVEATNKFPCLTFEYTKLVELEGKQGVSVHVCVV